MSHIGGFTSFDDPEPTYTKEQLEEQAKTRKESEETIEAALVEAKKLDKEAGVTPAPRRPTINDFIGGPEGDPNGPAYKPGVPAEHPYGVLYQGPWLTKADGFNEHVRRCARALALTGCPVHLRESGMRVSYGAPKDLGPKLTPLVRASIKNYTFSIHQMIPNEGAIRNITTHRFLAPEIVEKMNRFKVISTVFERRFLPDGVVNALDRAAQVWVACKANAYSLIASGLSASKVRIVPVPFFEDDPLLEIRGRLRKPGPPRFYHIGKWEPRKAQDKIILAFLRAFKPVEAQLIIRSSPLRTPIVGYPRGPHEAVAAALEDADVKKNGWTAENVKKALEIITEPLPDAAIVQLHSFGDVYVTLSRGEGYDMPAFDARLAGNRLVYTPSGGPQDFTSGAGKASHDFESWPGRVDFCVEISALTPCHPFYGWEEGAEYLDFDVKRAEAEMVHAAREVMTGQHNGVRPLPLDERHKGWFSAHAVGQRMLENLQELVPQGGRVF